MRTDRAVVHLELADRDAEPLRRALEHERAHLGRRLAQRAPAAHHREAPGGDALVERVVGVGGPHAHAGKGDVELVGGDACERADEALAELRLAGEDGHRVGFVDAHPRVEIGIRGERRGKPAHERAAAARRTARITRQCDPQRQRCGSSAARISSSLGSGLRSSSATAPMIIPAVQ